MSMVKEIRTIFNLSDIRAIRLHCNHCGGEAVQSIESTGPMPVLSPRVGGGLPWRQSRKQLGSGSSYAAVGRSRDRESSNDHPL